jgi:sRNA-binding protein
MSGNDIRDMLAVLAEWFPRAFVAERYLPHRPLKIGIHADLAIRCPALTDLERGAVLRFYTSRVMYLHSLTAGAARIDLDGVPVGTGTEQEAAHAAARLAALLAARLAAQATARAAAAARRAEQRPATRSATPPRQPICRHQEGRR